MAEGRDRSRSPSRQTQEDGRDRERSPSAAQASVDPNEGKMICLGVSWSTSSDRFRDYFAKFGELSECELVHDRDGRSRGFGFIHYKSMDVNRSVLRSAHELDGRRLELKIREFGSRHARGQAALKKVFVGRLPDGATEDELNRYFGSFGRVSDVFMPINKETRQKKGCAFVEFETADSAQAALRATHNLRGNDLTIEIAEPRKPLFGGGRGGFGGDFGGFNPFMMQQMMGMMGGGGGRGGFGGGRGRGGGGGGGYGGMGGGYGGGMDFSQQQQPDYSNYGTGYGQMGNAQADPYAQYNQGGYGGMGAYGGYDQRGGMGNGGGYKGGRGGYQGGAPGWGGY